MITSWAVAAMYVSNPNDSPVTIHGCDTAPAPTGFAEIVSVGGGLIHLLLVVAVVVLIINLIQGRRGL